MQMVVKAKFARELNRLHYPANTQVFCYTLQTVGFGGVVVNGDAFNTASRTCSIRRADARASSIAQANLSTSLRV